MDSSGAAGIGLDLLVVLVVLGIAWAWRASRSRLDRTTPMLDLSIDRDSVHASDDEGLVATRAVDPRITLSHLLADLQADGYLPTISGGKATWVIRSGDDRRPIGVMAQQWPRPRLRIVDVTLARHFHERRPALFFDYRCQVDPDEVWSTLQ